MPASSDSALLLAGRLRSLSDEALGELLSVREVRAAGIHDFFDLADALLQPDSVQAALARLDRSTLETLAALAEQGGTTSAGLAASLGRPDSESTDAALATAERLALVVLADATATPTQGLVDAFAAWPDLGLPTLAQLTAEPAPPTLAAVSDTERATTDRFAAERAFETTSEVAELLAELEHAPARELSRGGIALPDSRRLAAAMNVELDRVADLLDIAERAGLVARDAGHWVATDAGASWRGSSSGHRWALLAGAWLDRLPRDIRRILADRSHSRWGDRLSDYTTWLFPAGGEWMADRIAVYTRDAALLGITADHSPSTPGSALLAAGSAAAAELMVGLFPAEVDKVYLQHDLTVVSPGPLAPPVDARLRGIADLENRGLASTYRVSAATLTLALASGETADGIRQFLSQISLTGIPQPLEYLLREAAARFGLVRVRATPDGRAGHPLDGPDTAANAPRRPVSRRAGAPNRGRLAHQPLRSRRGVLEPHRGEVSGRRRGRAREDRRAAAPSDDRSSAVDAGCDDRAHRAASPRLERARRHPGRVARPPARHRHPEQERRDRDGAAARRQHRGLLARAGERRRRTAPRPRPRRRPGAHAAALQHRVGELGPSLIPPPNRPRLEG
jgi:hypothetical protein